MIVVDCAPTGETLRLLALPETLSFYAEKLFSAPQRLIRAIAAGMGGRTADGPDGQVRDAITELLGRLSGARELLTDPSSGITIVTTAEQVVLAEARRAYTALSLHGYPVTSVVVNRLLPDEAEGSWADRQRAAQQLQLLAVGESFAGLPIYQATVHAEEPVGAAALAELALEVYGTSDPLPIRPHTLAKLQVTGAEGKYSLALSLPLADRGQVQLSRAGDDLVVTVGNQRRRIALPSLLQRCTATGARFDHDQLVVSFEPDPARWPALVGT